MGLGDHLDVLGHYADQRALGSVPPDPRHVDWLTSGSRFDDRAFATLSDAIAGGMLRAAA